MADGVRVATGGGLGFTGALALAFIVLKLTGHLSWSWWWVLSPFWIPTALALAAVAFFAMITVSTFFIPKRGNRQ